MCQSAINQLEVLHIASHAVFGIKSCSLVGSEDFKDNLEDSLPKDSATD